MGYSQSLKIPPVKVKIAQNNVTQERKTLFKVIAVGEIDQNSV